MCESPRIVGRGGYRNKQSNLHVIYFVLSPERVVFFVGKQRLKVSDNRLNSPSLSHLRESTPSCTRSRVCAPWIICNVAVPISVFFRDSFLSINPPSVVMSVLLAPKSKINTFPVRLNKGWNDSQQSAAVGMNCNMHRTRTGSICIWTGIV